MHAPVLEPGAQASTLSLTPQPPAERGKPDMIIVAIVVALAVAGGAVLGARRNQVAATPQTSTTAQRDDPR